MTEILIIDDSLTVRMDLAEAIERAGLAAVPCATLAEGRIALAGRAIALVILDVRLPDGDGVNFLRELRADPRFVELPILMLSSEEEVADRLRGLRELEAFSYSVSHDLRAPLRAINAFTLALAEDLEPKLDDANRDHIKRVLAATVRMGDLNRRAPRPRADRPDAFGLRAPVDVSVVAGAVFEELRRRDPRRRVDAVVAPGVVAHADPRLLRVVLDNLIGNAWKFTSRRAESRIEVGRDARGLFVRDDGVGFEGDRADVLFRPFQRLHNDADFAGTGIGLATVQRIVERHRGKIWAESAVGAGATFRFTLAPD